MSITTHRKFVQIEVNRYPAIKRDKQKLILAHYFGEIDLKKSGRVLTLDEKKFLRLDQGKHITTAMVDLVDPSFATIFDIDEALRLITHNAKLKYRTSRTWQILTEDPLVSRIKFVSPMDKLTCKLCTSLHDKHLKKRFNLPRELEDSCNCLWFRGELQPVLAEHETHQDQRQANQRS